MRIVVRKSARTCRNGTPVGSTGATRFGKKLNEALFFAGDVRRGLDAPHASGARVHPVRAAVRRHHDRVAVAIERDGGAAVIEKAIHRVLVDRLQVIGPRETHPAAPSRCTARRTLRGLMKRKVSGWNCWKYSMNGAKCCSSGSACRILVDEDPVVEALAAHRDQRAARTCRGRRSRACRAD